MTELLHERRARARRATRSPLQRRLPRRLPPGPRAGRARAQPRELLARIPGLELVEPAEWELCCGSAGVYNMLQPEPAAELGRRKAGNLLATGAEAVIAGNPGCALQIAAHSEQLGRRLRVYHPMELLSDVDRGRTTAVSIEIRAPLDERFDEVLTDDALAFVGELHERFEPPRQELLRARAERQARFDAGETLDFLDETREVREGDWQVAPPPADLEDRRVEITGPTERKMVINALNSGARGFMADFEDSNSPTWANMIGGQVNLSDAIDRHDRVRRARRQRVPARRRGRDAARAPARLAPAREAPAGRRRADRRRASATSASTSSTTPSGCSTPAAGPYFYLPKMESHLEARLWNDVFEFAQESLGIEHGTIKATVLIETMPAAFEMEEILYELRDHSAGLNAGRWDYIFSAIKCFRERPEFVLPDRNSVTMTVPFMRAYTELLVKTCHRRGAHAMGGMAAFIPSRTDEEANEKAMAKLREDKSREAGDGFDGTWVAHPDLVGGGDGGVRPGARRPPEPGRPPARGGLGVGGGPARRRLDPRRDHR